MTATGADYDGLSVLCLKRRFIGSQNSGGEGWLVSVQSSLTDVVRLCGWIRGRPADSECAVIEHQQFQTVNGLALSCQAVQPWLATERERKQGQR